MEGRVTRLDMPGYPDDFYTVIEYVGLEGVPLKSYEAFLMTGPLDSPDWQITGAGVGPDPHP